MDEDHATTERGRHGHEEPGHEDDWYRIRIQGRLETRWASWFDRMQLTCDGDGTTLLEGRVPDQAALHGLLTRAAEAQRAGGAAAAGSRAAGTALAAPRVGLAGLPLTGAASAPGTSRARAAAGGVVIVVIRARSGE